MFVILDVFVRHFLFQTDRSIDADDLLFFVRKKHVRGNVTLPKFQVTYKDQDFSIYFRDY